jgi:hypothetical protein
MLRAQEICSDVLSRGIVDTTVMKQFSALTMQYVSAKNSSQAVTVAAYDNSRF